ncbi:hypothetical protein MC7420_5809 [Coleofasciculus chthonoplastes PCC 7420]|uniref:Uncharacterized protein n=1 Tax=Coleofasciculus chthonoplastes PCC 7420 TaxID=118168 RepID=B4VVH8_9CYAN|nr:hypothetical protein MC7420_5809 [Coleofasciculus chthonoplastes PCC 7420]
MFIPTHKRMIIRNHQSGCMGAEVLRCAGAAEEMGDKISIA